MERGLSKQQEAVLTRAQVEGGTLSFDDSIRCLGRSRGHPEGIIFLFY